LKNQYYVITFSERQLGRSYIHCHELIASLSLSLSLSLSPFILTKRQSLTISSVAFEHGPWIGDLSLIGWVLGFTA